MADKELRKLWIFSENLSLINTITTCLRIENYNNFSSSLRCRKINNSWCLTNVAYLHIWLLVAIHFTWSFFHERNESKENLGFKYLAVIKKKKNLIIHFLSKIVLRHFCIHVGAVFISFLKKRRVQLSNFYYFFFFIETEDFFLLLKSFIIVIENYLRLALYTQIAPHDKQTGRGLLVYFATFF